MGFSNLGFSNFGLSNWGFLSPKEGLRSSRRDLRSPSRAWAPWGLSLWAVLAFRAIVAAGAEVAARLAVGLCNRGLSTFGGLAVRWPVGCAEAGGGCVPSFPHGGGRDLYPSATRPRSRPLPWELQAPLRRQLAQPPWLRLQRPPAWLRLPQLQMLSPLPRPWWQELRWAAAIPAASGAPQVFRREVQAGSGAGLPVPQEAGGGRLARRRHRDFLRGGRSGERRHGALHLLLLHAVVETFQDAEEILARTADKRHHVGHDHKASAFHRTRRTRFLGEARAPEHAVADHVGQTFQHVDADDTAAADPVAADAIKALRRRTVESGRGEPLPRRLGQVGGIELAFLLELERPEEQAEFGGRGLEQSRHIEIECAKAGAEAAELRPVFLAQRLHFFRHLVAGQHAQRFDQPERNAAGDAFEAFASSSLIKGSSIELMCRSMNF
jgi:hypothetical protein